MPASGVRSAKATSRSMAPSSTTVSGLSSSRYLPRAPAAATLLPRAKPRFSGLAISRRAGKAAAIAAAEPSGEALSSTTISCGSVVSAATLRRQSSVIALVL